MATLLSTPAKVTSKSTGLAGIQQNSGPTGSVHAGVFQLPPSFQQDKYAANWAKEGSAVEAARQREPILGTDMTADGWEIYKDGGKAVKVTTEKSGVFILMFRPKTVQRNVNAIYGNTGKHIAKSEQLIAPLGTSGENGQDPGMLPSVVLDQVGLHEQQFAPDDEDNHFAENPVEGVGPGGNVTTKPLRT